MSSKAFSYTEYAQILHKFKEKLVDYSETRGRNIYVLLRHDVEYSPEKALEMAKIENSLDIKSSYLFQVKSNAYNSLSLKNTNIIKRILELDHKVGLHFYVRHIEANNWEKLKDELIQQRNILKLVLGFKPDRFSYHRPPDWVLTRSDNLICEMINMYGSNFFEFTKTPRKIKYLSDSGHLFKYGHPLDDINFKKIQILLHPDEWSHQGYNIYKNFRSLEKKHLTEFYRTLNQESKIYRENLPKEVDNENSDFWQ